VNASNFPLALIMAPKPRKIGSTRFTDGIERDVFEDAEGRQFVEDDGELVAGQWLPSTDEPALPAGPQ
jgi:hypothetical protein